MAEVLWLLQEIEASLRFGTS